MAYTVQRALVKAFYAAYAAREIGKVAEFIADLPVSASAGVTRPQMTAMPLVWAAICSAALRLCSTKEVRSTKSRGG